MSSTGSTISNKNPNIVVTVRIRPPSEFERGNKDSALAVKCMDERVVIFDPADLNKPQQRGPQGVRRGKDIQFGFDRVFDQYASQYEVFQHTTQVLVNEVLNGYNCACFAYGATGAGKTFTMVGTESAPGVMVLTLQELFSAMKATQDERKYSVKISYLEVYNENIHDLLVPRSKPLALLESGDQMTVLGLTQHEPKSADEILQLLQEGNTRRAQNFTHANAESSRSHAVLQVIVEQRDRTANVTTGVRTAKFSLIDLAGSERASRTKNRGKQLVEGANINRSLLALGNCINALGSGYTEGKYVPYRDSKLTRLLKDSLGGNCKTIMISNVSPSTLSYEDTFNTLQYANRAKNIKTKVRANEINLVVHVSEYKDIIADLRKEVEEWKQKCASFETQLEEEGRARQAAIDMEFDEQVSSSTFSARLGEASSSRPSSSQSTFGNSRPTASTATKPTPAPSLPLLSRTVSMGLATPRNSKIEKRLINLSSQVDDVITDRRNVQKHLEEIMPELLELNNTKTQLIEKIRDSEESLKLHLVSTPLASPRPRSEMMCDGELEKDPIMEESVDAMPLSTPAKRTSHARLHRTSPPRDVALRKELELLERKLEGESSLRMTLLQRLERNAETTKRLQTDLSQFTPHAEDVALHRQLKLELVINALEISNFNKSMRETQLQNAVNSNNERCGKALELVELLRAALGEYTQEESPEVAGKYEHVMQLSTEAPSHETILQLPSPYAPGGRSPFTASGRSPFASSLSGLDATYGAGPTTPSRFHLSGAQDAVHSASSSMGPLGAASLDSPSLKSTRIPFPMAGGASQRQDSAASSSASSRPTQGAVRSTGVGARSTASSSAASRPNPLVRSGKKTGSGISVGAHSSRITSGSSSASTTTTSKTPANTSSAKPVTAASSVTTSSRLGNPPVKSHVRVTSNGAPAASSVSSASTSSSSAPTVASSTATVTTATGGPKRMGLPQRIGTKAATTATATASITTSSASASATTNTSSATANMTTASTVTPTKVPARFRNDPHVAKALASFRPTFEPAERSSATATPRSGSSGSNASSSAPSAKMAGSANVATPTASASAAGTAGVSTPTTTTATATTVAGSSIKTTTKMSTPASILAKSSSSPTANAISAVANLANIQAGLSASASATSINSGSPIASSSSTSSSASYKYEPNALAALLSGGGSGASNPLDSFSSPISSFSRPPTAGTVYSPSSPSTGISSSPLVTAAPSSRNNTAALTGSPISPMSKPMRV